MTNLPTISDFFPRLKEADDRRGRASRDMKEIYREAAEAGHDRIALAQAFGAWSRRERAREAGQREVFDGRAGKVASYLQQIYSS